MLVDRPTITKKPKENVKRGGGNKNISLGSGLISCSGGEEKGENAADTWVTSWGMFLYGCMEKEKPRPKSFLQEAAQRWTLKGVFLFFHSAWVGAPKICRLFLLFPRCQLW